MRLVLLLVCSLLVGCAHKKGITWSVETQTTYHPINTDPDFSVKTTLSGTF
jgi:hypothetical protein